MKYSIVTIVILLSLGACQEEKVEPAQADPFVGSWHYTDSYADIELEVSFNVALKDGEYVFSNIKVHYKDIPDNIALSMDTFDKFADNDGFGKIRIHGSWTPTSCMKASCDDKFIFINLNYNNINKGGNAMAVDEVEVNYNNFEIITLEGQMFHKG